MRCWVSHLTFWVSISSFVKLESQPYDPTELPPWSQWSKQENGVKVRRKEMEKQKQRQIKQELNIWIKGGGKT